MGWAMRFFLVLVCSFALVACSSGSSTSGSSSSADSGAADSGADQTSPEVGTSTDSWASYAAGFFTAYCTECHNSGDATGRDYTVQAIVLKDKAAMRCGVAITQDPSWNCAASPVAKQFPIGSGPKPSDADRNRIVAWISAGEP